MSGRVRLAEYRRAGGLEKEKSTTQEVQCYSKASEFDRDESAVDMSWA